MHQHPTLIPFGGVLTICWYEDRDGRCHAREFYDANKACKAGLLAQASQYAATGRVAKVPENGHRLQGEYRDLYEFKPGNFRFIGFRYRDTFYLTNAAHKSPKKKQDRDYRLALRLRTEFIARLEEDK